MTESNINGFEIVGQHYKRDGVAKDRGFKNFCKKKLCLFSTDKNLLFDLTSEASRANDCFQVLISKDDRLDIFLGQCVYTNESSVGDAWARYTSHPKVWAVVQDDEFCDKFKDRVRNYSQ